MAVPQPGRGGAVVFAYLALLGALAALAAYHVMPWTAFRGCSCDSATGGPFLTADLRRLPGIIAATRAAPSRGLNTGIDRLGPGSDAPDAGAPLDAWDRLNRWAKGYNRRFDPFFGDDY